MILAPRLTPIPVDGAKHANLKAHPPLNPTVRRTKSTLSINHQKNPRLTASLRERNLVISPYGIM